MSTSNLSLNIHFCVETEIQGKPWKINKILRVRNSRLGAFFQKEIFIPGKIANHPKFLDLVSTNVGLNPDIQIGVGLFTTAKYQHSQNGQNLAICVNEALARQETFQQLSLKMSQPTSMMVPWGEIFFCLVLSKQYRREVEISEYVHKVINSQPFLTGSWQFPVHYWNNDRKIYSIICTVGGWSRKVQIWLWLTGLALIESRKKRKETCPEHLSCYVYWSDWNI